MKKLVSALIAVCLLASSPLFACADSLYEPANDFFVRQRDQIVYLGRAFSTNAVGGSVGVKNEPGATRELTRLPNGKETYIQYSCLYDGEYWGFAPEHSGWIELGELLVHYDYIAFEEDHLDEFYTYKGDYSQIKEGGGAVAWAWPGSGDPLWTFEGLDAAHFSPSYAYRDADGREWGFVPYLHGNRNIWVCLSDPLSRDIPAFNPAPEPAPWSSDTFHYDISASDGGGAIRRDEGALMRVAVSVSLLVAVTAVLIRLCWKPNAAKPPRSADE